MKKVDFGHTNDNKFIDDDKFIVEKTYTGFNHGIKYMDLNQFDFCPEIIEDTKEKVVQRFIEGEMVFKPTNDDLVQLATHLRTLHKSELKFPKNNLRKRVVEYLRIIHDKKLHIPAIEDNYKDMTRLIQRMGRLNPCHNDVWVQNIMKDKAGKVFLVDWEYATMGDKHFDLAYFIMSAKLNKEQEKVFLDTYNSMDDYQAWIPEFMPKYKKFVTWLTIVWAYAQDKMPFDLSELIALVENNRF